MKPRIEQLTLGGDPAAWRRAGFTVSADGARIGTVRLQFAPGEGIVGWRLAGVAAEIDGLPLAAPGSYPAFEAAHQNGAIQIDHLVIFTPELDRTTRALEDVGIERRRVREVETDCGLVRQGFFRLGEVILEVAQHRGVEPGPARFWGSRSPSGISTSAPSSSATGSARSATPSSRDGASRPYVRAPGSASPSR